MIFKYLILNLFLIGYLNNMLNKKKHLINFVLPL